MNVIYICDISSCKINYDQLRSSLPNQCLNIIDKYKLKDDYTRSLVAWFILSQKIDLINNKLTFNEYNKPSISNVFFNISHSENIVVVMINDSKCGIDVEFINGCNDRVAKRILTKDEYDKYLYEGKDYFYEKWTKIEAYYKYKGTGIILSKLSDSLDDLNLHSKYIYDSINNRYCLSFMSENDITDIELFML